ncbi:MAG: molybdenum hydroxylase, partial [Desulfobacteraceae bacterium]|nr:molybdenum hydroxylase [Desulfobacteraceae bacterium]
MKIKNISELIIAVKGAGEMATGLACRLFQSNFKNIFMMETENPMAVRRQVSFCEAIHDRTIIVENVTAKKVLQPDDFKAAWDTGQIPVIVDPDWNSIKLIKP